MILIFKHIPFVLFSLQISNENSICVPSTSSTFDPSTIIDDFDFLQLYDDDSDDERSQPQAETKTIPLQQYKDLMQLIPQVERMKNSMQRMESVIKSKDSQLEELRQALKRKEEMTINTSKLSTVSTL